MSTNKKSIIIVCCIFLIVALLFTILVLTSRIEYNDDATVGNTAGNLNNGGLFCETEDKVFFSNAYDGDTLYCMNPDETEINKIGENKVASINAGGKYIYYYMESGTNGSGSGLGFMNRTAGIYRSDRNGKHTLCLDRTFAVTMQLCGNYLYYQDLDTKSGTSLSKIKIDKTDKTTVADYIINPVSYVNGNIYFNGTQDDHALYTLNTRNDNITKIWQSDIWNPIYQDGYIYYMDVANNYRLCRYSLSGDVVEVLTNDRVDFFNVYDYYIYYQTSSATNPALKRMYIDGTNAETVIEGVYENINITSNYVYFNLFNEPVPVYKTSTFGGTYVTTFDAARDAAMEKRK